MKNKFIGAIPLFVLLIIELIVILDTINNDYLFEMKNLIGYTLSMISLVVLFIHKTVFKIIFSITLLFGLFGAVHFTTVQYTFSINKGSVSFTVEMVSLVLFLAFILLNKSFFTFSEAWGD